MKLARLKRRSYEDSSALSDLAFLLIIYFIVIAGFNINKGFLMNLPVKDSTRYVLKDDLMRFDLDAAGVISCAGETMDTAAAESEIRNMIAAHPNLAVVLTIHPEAPWQSVVSFVELAQKMEVESFSFSMSDDYSTGGN